MKRLIIATLSGLLFGFVCFGFACSGDNEIGQWLVLTIIAVELYWDLVLVSVASQ